MRPDNLEALLEDLRSYHADLEAPELRAELVDACLPRLLATLDMLPESARSADILELGATPFFLTLCLRRLCTGRLALGNWFGTQDRSGSQRLTHARSGDQIDLAYDLFNIETDLFPHPDASFDVVVFAELIEHLGVNPVRTLSEIHRVLRPDGTMILTTPNSISLERLETYLRGGSQMVDRYSPLFGPGARHNREYHVQELRELLEGNGFTIEQIEVRDLIAHTQRDQLRRTYWRFLLSWFALDELAGSSRVQQNRFAQYLLAWDALNDLHEVPRSRLERLGMYFLAWNAAVTLEGEPRGGLDRLRRTIAAARNALEELRSKPRGVRERLERIYGQRLRDAAALNPRAEHIFLRARRSGRFRWHFPTRLFDNIDFYILVRHPWTEMGINDTIQCGEGWFGLATQDGKTVRSIRGVAQGFLKSQPGKLLFHLELYAPPGATPLTAHVIVWDRWLGRPKVENVYVDDTVPLERGCWQTIDLPLGRHPLPDDEIEIRLAINGDARSGPPLADPATDERVAVHRFWFTAKP
jgi:SAM-dependent methyltransferase